MLPVFFIFNFMRSRDDGKKIERPVDETIQSHPS